MSLQHSMSSETLSTRAFTGDVVGQYCRKRNDFQKTVSLDQLDFSSEATNSSARLAFKHPCGNDFVCIRATKKRQAWCTSVDTNYFIQIMLVCKTPNEDSFSINADGIHLRLSYLPQSDKISLYNYSGKAIYIDSNNFTAKTEPLCSFTLGCGMWTLRAGPEHLELCVLPRYHETALDYAGPSQVNQVAEKS